MAETQYSLYESYVADNGDQRLTFIKTVSAKSAKAALGTIADPDPDVPYAAIPIRNITVSKPKVVPQRVTW